MHTNIFTCSSTSHMLVKDPKENMLVQNTYLAFSYFSALEIPPQLTTSHKKKIPMQFPVLQTGT